MDFVILQFCTLTTDSQPKDKWLCKRKKKEKNLQKTNDKFAFTVNIYLIAVLTILPVSSDNNVLNSECKRNVRECWVLKHWRIEATTKKRRVRVRVREKKEENNIDGTRVVFPRLCAVCSPPIPLHPNWLIFVKRKVKKIYTDNVVSECVQRVKR